MTTIQSPIESPREWRKFNQKTQPMKTITLNLDSFNKEDLSQCRRLIVNLLLNNERSQKKKNGVGPLNSVQLRKQEGELMVALLAVDRALTT